MALLVAACGDDGDGSAQANRTGSAATESAETADRGAAFEFATAFGFGSLDPHRAPSELSSMWLKPLYDRLLTLVEGPSGVVELGPQLATSFEVAPDGLSISFELRDDVMFQDGTSFNGAAVKANIERAKGPESTVATPLKAIATVEVVDDTHVVFHLSEPDGSILWAMASSTTGSMISPAAFNTDLVTAPVGSGPFKLVSAQKDADTVYERWDGHWDENAALVQKLTISTVPDPNARYNGLRSGTYDAAYLSPPQDLEAKTLEADGYHYLQRLSSDVISLGLNSKRPPFDDVRVRQAVSMAINRKEISETLLQGLVPPAYQFFMKGFLGYDESLDKDTYDPDEARRLLREARAEGATVRVLQQLNPPLDALAEVVQQALADVGLNVELTPLSGTEAFTAWQKGDFDAQVAGVALSPDPTRKVFVYLGGLGTPVQPPADVVAMADQAKVLTYGSDEQEKAYKEISRLLVEDPLHVPIARVATVIVSRPNVVGTENLMVEHVLRVDFRGVGIATS